MTIEPTSANATLLGRVKNILMQPQKEWDVIAREEASAGALATGYVVPLAAISAVAGLLGALLYSGFYLGGITWLLADVVWVLLCSVLGFFVCGILINALASTFGSEKDQMRAYQLSAYSATAGLLGGVGALLGALAPAVSLVAFIYSVMLLYMGLPRLMKTPEDKRVPYVATIIILAIVFFAVVSWALMPLYVNLRGSPFGAVRPSFHFSETRPTPSAQSQVAAPEPSAGAAPSSGPADPDRLAAYLTPTMPNGFTLMSSSRGEEMGVVTAQGVYQRGDAHMTVTVVHLGQLGGLAAAAAGMNLSENSEDANGYSRTNAENGRMVTEQVNRARRTASYIVVGRGVSVAAEGDGVTVEEVRAAVEAVGIERVESAR